jgi:hypothetical protein
MATLFCSILLAWLALEEDVYIEIRLNDIQQRAAQQLREAQGILRQIDRERALPPMKRPPPKR